MFFIKTQKFLTPKKNVPRTLCTAIEKDNNPLFSKQSTPIQEQIQQQIELLKVKYPNVVDKELLKKDLKKSEEVRHTFSYY